MTLSTDAPRQELLAAVGPSSRRRSNRELAALRKAFRLAARQKRIATVPEIAMLAENNVRQGFVEPGAFETIVAALPEYVRDFVRFAYLTGWRRGEIRSLEWSAVNRESKTVFLGRSKNGEPRILPLVGELERIIIKRRWLARTIENANGNTLLASSVFHCGDGRPIGDFRKSWRVACRKAGLPNLLLHDLRRSAVRNFDRSGISQIVGMMISGHKTASVYKRYRIVPENDIREALQRVEQAIKRAKEKPECHCHDGRQWRAMKQIMRSLLDPAQITHNLHRSGATR